MAIPVRSVGFSAMFLSAAALLAGPSLAHDQPPDDGSEVCLGSIGTVVCVPPDQMPPSPPSAPAPPPPPPSASTTG